MTDDIIPDTKNWTWVLEERCGQCGFDASTFEATRTGDAVLDLAGRWQEVLRRSDVGIRERPGQWSALEYACHVRDVFRLFDQRLGLMLSQDDPIFPNWDQDQTAVDEQYARQNPLVVQDQLHSAATSLAAHFASVTGREWERRGTRSDGSAFTVESFARYFMHDPIHHLWDVGAEVPDY